MPAEDDLILLRQVITARSAPVTSESFDNENTSALFNDLMAVRSVLTQFSRGIFNTEITGRNVFAASLKALQANLRHLIWQVQEVAKGDFSQRVEFMGEFSAAFNTMTQQLERAITELKEREARLLALTADLRASEERWNLAVQCSRDGIWDINIDTKTAWYSESFMQMMHYGKNDLPEDLCWETHIHPDDRAQAEVMSMMLQGIGDISPFSVECRIRTPQDDYVWVRIRGMPVSAEHSRRLIAVASDISSQKEVEKSLAHRAMHDNLTGLPNRYLLNDRLKQLVANSERSKKPFVLVTLDLDFFKGVNDTYGHAGGDLILVELAKRLSAGLRHTDTAARLGGDEFVAIYPCDEGMEQQTAESVMNRFFENLKPLVSLGDTMYQIRSSVGVAFFPKHASDLTTLFEHVDAALYKAKKNGKNQYAIWDPNDEPTPK